MSQCTRFIECNGINLRQFFHNMTTAHKKTVLTSIGNSGHDSSRRCKYQRARTEHNENRHGTNHFAGYHIRTNRCKKGHHHNPCSPAVCKAHDFRIAWIRFLNELNHTLNRTIFAGLRSLHIEGAKLVNRTREHVIAYHFIHRHGFTSHNGLVHRCGARANGTVYRDDFTRQHTNHIAYFDDICRNNLLLIVAYNTRCRWCQFNKTFNARLCFGHSEIFEHGAQLHDESNFCSCKIFTDDHRCDEG